MRLYLSPILTYLISRENNAREFAQKHSLLAVSWFAIFVMVIYTFYKGATSKFKVITHNEVIRLINADEAIVVDYKFGAQQQSYHDQVKRYCQLIQQMGKQHVKGYLWYVDKDFIEEVI